MTGGRGKALKGFKSVAITFATTGVRVLITSYIRKPDLIVDGIGPSSDIDVEVLLGLCNVRMTQYLIDKVDIDTARLKLILRVFLKS